MKWIYKVSTGPIALISLVVFLIFAFTVLPDQASKAKEATGSAESPDTTLFYTADDLYDMAQTYGEEGRSAYFRARFTFDLAWPAVYTFFFLASTGWIIQQVSSEESRVRRLIVVPLLAVILDLLENISTSLVMARYPAATPLVDSLAPVFTFLKWMLVAASTLILMIGLIAAVRQRLRGLGR